MQGLGATGSTHAKDCTFDAGTVSGAPLKVSWFLVIIFVYQLMEGLKNKQLPPWAAVAQVVGNEFLLLLTVLCHEMGHGTMARRLGGEIAQVLLWPFGGICFTTRPSNRDSKQKLVDDLKIVAAGPATHFPMAGAWLVALVALRFSWSLAHMDAAWRLLVPFSTPQMPCYYPGHDMVVEGCVHTIQGYLFHSFLVQAVQINVMLFMFNVFFPMYPMDGAKLIVCSLQLFCKASARTAAKVLVFTSFPLSVFFIYRAFAGARGGGVFTGISAYMGIMCMAETYKIYQLMKSQQLHTHPLFETARSQVISTVDSSGAAQRLNDSNRDDEEAPARASSSWAWRTEMRPFSGAGRLLGVPGSQQPEPVAVASPAVQHLETEGGAGAAAQPGTAKPAPRSSLLDRLERDSSERNKSVQQLQDERLEQQRLEREYLVPTPAETKQGAL